jgi:hypothetical protein
LHEENENEAQRNTDAEMSSCSAAGFSAGDCDADNGEHESGEWICDAFVLFNFIQLHIIRAFHFFIFNKMIELYERHAFHPVLCTREIFRIEIKSGIDACAFYQPFMISVNETHGIIKDAPTAFHAVPLDLPRG